MSKTYAEFEKMAAEYAAKKEKTLEQLENGIEASGRAASEASEKMRNAVTNWNSKEYKAAAEAYEDALHMRDYISKRKELELNGTKEEAEKSEEFIQQLRDKASEEAKAYIANIRGLLDEIAGLNNAFSEDCEAAENVIRLWHTKVRRFKKQVGMRGTEPYCVEDVPKLGVDVGSVNRFTNEVNEYREKLDRIVY